MLITEDLKDREFLAKVLPDLDNRRQGRYRVHIPDLMPSIDENKGIWVKNQTHKWRITNSERGEYGQYFPIQPGTKVIVKFFENDSNSGYIDRIISDHVQKSNVEAQDCTAEFADPKDRDEQYVIFKTPKKWNVFYVNEDTENEPNTIYLIYNRDNYSFGESDSAKTDENSVPIGRRTVFRIDESGLTFWTRDNVRTRIKLDDNKQVDGNQTEYITGYRTKHIDGDDDLHVHENQRINIDKDQDEWVKGNRTETIDLDVNTHIKQNSITTIDIDEDKHIGGNLKTNIDKNEDRTVGGSLTTSIGSTEDKTISSDLTTDVGGSENRTVTSSRMTDVGESDNLNVGTDFIATAGSSISLMAPTISLSASGSGDSVIDVSESYSINAGTTLNIGSGGDCTIDVGGDLSISATGAISLSSATSIDLYAPTIANHEGLTNPVPASPMEPLNSTPASPSSASSPDSAADSEDADVAKPVTMVRDLGPGETVEYDITDDENDGRPVITGDKCDDATSKYNKSSRQTLPE